MKKNKKSGIILITTLIFMTLTFMLTVMICKNGKESIFAGNRYAENEQAYLSALSGIEFIKGQLSKDKDWLLSESNVTKYISSSSNNIKIVKENNAIIGYILLDCTKGAVSNENYDSKFEIFLENNSSIKEYKSVNNLFNNKNLINNENKREIPAKSFYAYVKGTCGKTTRYAEALLISKGDTALNGGNIINGTVSINSVNNSTNNFESDHINDNPTKEIYTKENPFITINDKNKNKYGKITANGSLLFDCGDNNPSTVLNSSNNTIISSSGIKIGNFTGQNDIEDASHIQYDSNPQISDELKNYDSNIDDKEFSSLTEGTYVFINDVDNNQDSKWIHLNSSTNINKNNLKTIIENASENEKQIIPCDGIEFVKKLNKTTEPDQIPTTHETRTVKITGKISSDSLNFIVVDKSNKNGYTLSDINTVDFSMIDNSIIKTTGNLYINGEVTGNGKIYCGGDLTMNAGSQLETKVQSGVAVYANGNVNIKEAQNLSSDSNNIENIIVEEAVKEAKDKLNISDETEININGRTISLETITNSNIDAAASVSFQRTKYYDNWWGCWRNLTNPINYTIKINNDSLYIYKNNETIPMFTRTFNELKTQMYDVYEWYRIGPYWIRGEFLYNSYDRNPNAKNYSYNDDGIYQNGITLYDYNRAHSNSNYVGDMKLYIDGYLVGIIDINPKIEETYSKYYENNIFIAKNSEASPQNYILFSMGDYKGNTKTEQCFTNFMCVNSNSSNNPNFENPEEQNNEIIANTIQEYVNTYYKKQVRNTEIKGTVFSKNGKITIDGSGGKFNIIGALITANEGGNLTINNASYVNLTYDPDYVPFFTDQGILTTTLFESVF